LSEPRKRWDRKRVAHLRRVVRQGSRGLDRLAAFCELSPYMTKMLDDAVTLARTQGATWSEIGEALGTSEQAAHKRFAGHIN
jgi:hypothetical protein